MYPVENVYALSMEVSVSRSHHCKFDIVITSSFRRWQLIFVDRSETRFTIKITEDKGFVVGELKENLLTLFQPQ